MQHLGYKNGRAVFCTWSVPRCYKQGTKLVDSSVREFVKRGAEPEVEEYSLFEPLPGNV
jgi:hypothetical protein